jgi:murein DD-endopeptidase MepM/ murein hydrolase activator NlpD
MNLIPTEDSESFLTMEQGTTGIPLNPHPGSFGFERKNHVHEGVDIYCPEHTSVHAVEDGVVVAVVDFTGEKATPPSPWWNDTMAVLVEGETGVVVYGEIKPARDYKTGDTLNAGDEIGRVIPVLKKDKGRPMTMLHLELHRHGTRDAFEWPVGGPCPDSLLDPTPHLLNILHETVY